MKPIFYAFASADPAVQAFVLLLVLVGAPLVIAFSLGWDFEDLYYAFSEEGGPIQRARDQEQAEFDAACRREQAILDAVSQRAAADAPWRGKPGRPI